MGDKKKIIRLPIEVQRDYLKAVKPVVLRILEERRITHKAGTE